MHQIVLLTAMTATSGLFGGHHGRTNSCNGGSCARPAAAAYAPAATCRSGNCGTGSYAPAAHHAYGPQMAPARSNYRTSNYYPPASSCATGNCPRR